MCGGFFLKFSNIKVNSEDRNTLTHNDCKYTTFFVENLIFY